MKKLLILLMIFSCIFINQSIKSYASDTEIPDHEISQESISLIHSERVEFTNLDFDYDHYLSTGFVSLRMGYSTGYLIDLSNLSSLFQYYNELNVSRLYLYFDVQAVYTGVPEADHRWYSYQQGFDPINKTLEIDTSTNSLDMEVWWNVLGQSGGAPSTGYPGGIFLYDVKLKVEYTEPVTTAIIIDTVNGQPDWSQLPETVSNPIEKNPGGYGSAEFYHVEYNESIDLHFYDLFITYDSNVYLVEGISLPFLYGEYAKGFYYTYDDGNGKDRFVWFFGDKNGVPLEQPNIDANNIVWNLTDGMYKLTENKTVHAKPYAVGNGFTSYNQLYIDLIVPWNIQDLMSITLNYDYRYSYLISFGKSRFGDWQSVVGQTFIKNDNDYKWYGIGNNVDTTALPWWIDMTGIFNLMFVNNPNTLIGRYLAVEDIEDITTKVDRTYKSDYVKYMDEYGLADVEYTEENIFMEDFKAYSLYVGQFDKVGSNGIQARDIVIVQMTVTSDDIPYTVIYPPQDTAQMPEPNVPGIVIPGLEETKDWFQNLIEKIWQAILYAYQIMIPVIAIGVFLVAEWFIQTITKKKMKSTKKRWALYIGIVVIMFILFRV